VHRFHATVVEVFGTRGNTDEPLTVHFDDEGSRYLQLQEIPDRYHDPESARVYVEVDDQGRAGGDCFAAAELARNSFRIALLGEPTLDAIGELRVTFDLDDTLFQVLKSGLKSVFDGVEEYRCLADTSPKEKGT